MPVLSTHLVKQLNLGSVGALSWWASRATPTALRHKLVARFTLLPVQDMH